MNLSCTHSKNSVRLVCFSLNEARAQYSTVQSSVKNPFETCFLEVKANMLYLRYCTCNSSEN